MNIKFSQIPKTSKVRPEDTIAILRTYENLMLPVSAMYTYLSGDKLIDVYTSYSNTSANYLLSSNPQIQVWNNTSVVVNRDSDKWNNSSNLVSSISSNFIFSNSSLVPGSSAIKNIVALTQGAYDSLVTIDPNTYYVIAS